ncbi:MAG: SdrD B-like domain-containing protein [Saccharofermentanales bacterium]
MMLTKRILSYLIVFSMLISLFSAFALAEPIPEAQFAYVPNAFEASVSKVNLLTATEVARYSTVLDRSGGADAWEDLRVSRLAVDSNGNAWALNTMTGQGAPDAQGTIVRISGTPVTGETDGVNTSNSGGLTGIVTGDLRVSIFNVGAPGDAPRTINIVEEEGEVFLWIGFYDGSYFLKYHYNTGAVPATLDVVSTQFSVLPYTPYSSVMDNSGKIWVSSRNANPYGETGPQPGVFYFDTQNLATPLVPVICPFANPYYIMKKSDGTIWVSDGSDWSTAKPRQFAVYTPVNPAPVMVDVGSCQAMRGFTEDAAGNIWATSIDGQVFKLDASAGYAPSLVLSGLGELAGIGMGADGMGWVVVHGSDKLIRFDPANPAGTSTDVSVGDGPYAYGDFTVLPPPELYRISGYKLNSDTGAPIEGWLILLFKKTGEDWGVEPFRTTLTGADGKYSFLNLPEGEYLVKEEERPGWERTSPINADDGYVVTLPDTNAIYGISREATKKIYEIDPITGLSTPVFTPIQNAFNISGPNGLAYDSADDILYYVTYPADISIDPTFAVRAKMYKLENGIETYVGDLAHEIACADFYNGKYYYIAGGNIYGGTDDMYEVTFNVDGSAIDHVTNLGSISNNLYSWMFYGDIAISQDGTLYGSGKNYNNPAVNGDFQFFKVQLNGTGFTMINPNLGKPLQLAYGGDGVLYGHNLDLHAYYAVDTVNGTIGEPVSYSDILPGFNDMASGNLFYNFENRERVYEICGYKLNDATGAPVASWQITLKKWDGDSFEPYGSPMMTDEYGRYCFVDLPAGRYEVSEGVLSGWEQVFPGGDGKHIISLPAAENLVANGDFELGNTGFGSDYEYIVVPSHEHVDSMYEEGTYAIGINPQLYHELWTPYSDHTMDDVNSNMMIVNGEDTVPGQRVWYGTFAVQAATDYTFSFWGATSYPAAYASLKVYINDILIDTYNAPAVLATWTKYSVVWPSGAAVEARIKLVCDTLVHTGTDFALDDISLTPYNLDFRNVEAYDICGYKFRAGTTDGLAGWTINLYDAAGAIIATTKTDANGKYCFSDLVSGTYYVDEVIDDPDHWVQTFPAAGGNHMVILPIGASHCDGILGTPGAYFYNFENEELYDLCGFKINGDTGEVMRGWTIKLFQWDVTAGDWAGTEFRSDITDGDGKYCFSGLQAGRYKIEEVLQDNWARLIPADDYQLSLPAGKSDCTAVFGAGANQYNFTNVPLYDLCGYKINGDTNEGIAGWIINLYKWDPSIGVWSDIPFRTTSTLEGGKYCFNDLLAGRYKIEEEAQDDWLQLSPTTNGGAHLLSLPSGASDCTAVRGAEGAVFYDFVNAPLFELCGYKINGDTNEGIVNWTINLYKWDASINGWSDKIFETTTTNGDGKYCFDELRAGRYRIAEELQTDWVQLSPATNGGAYLLSLPAGASDCTAVRDDAEAVFYNFVNAPVYDLCGYKIHGDTNEGITGWTINLYKWDPAIGAWSDVVFKTTLTDADGKYCFENLRVGRYKIAEVLQTDWVQLSPLPETNGGAHLLSLPAGASDCTAVRGDTAAVFYNFVNAPVYDLCGFKYGVNLLDMEAIDKPLAGWTMNLYKWDPAMNAGTGGYPATSVRTVTTGSDGKYCFLDLRAGQYKIDESYGPLNTEGFWEFGGKYYRPYDPANGSIEVNLPGDETVNAEGPFHSFWNQCFGKETAWAYGTIKHNELGLLTSNNWGWSFKLGCGKLEGTPSRMLYDDKPIFAGAGQNVLTKGYLVGYVDVEWTGTAIEWTITYVDGVVKKVEHVYVGSTKLPLFKGKMTNAPGQFKVNFDPSKQMYMAIHLDVYVPCGMTNYEIRNKYTLNITSVNNYDGYNHIFTIIHDPNDDSFTGTGTGAAGTETLSDFHFVKEGDVITCIDFKSTYTNGYVWYPRFLLNHDLTLTFVDGAGADNVTAATGTWSVVAMPF